jgi:protein involved in polysaccharide export with SLBB domain
MPGFLELLMVINPTGKVKRKSPPSSGVPQLYAPWPGTRRKGIIELEVAGETLRALFTEIGSRYKKAEVDFQPVSSKTNQLDPDYNVWVNQKLYATLPEGLETRLGGGDEVKVRVLWRWDG